jgi:hypothetical protein
VNKRSKEVKRKKGAITRGKEEARKEKAQSEADVLL